MTELAMLQNELNKMEQQTAHVAVKEILRDGVAMLKNGGHPNAIAAYLQMAVYFYGKQRIATALEAPKFRVLQKYMR